MDNQQPLPTERQVPTDEFRALADMGKPDWRQSVWLVFESGGGTRPKVIEDVHQLVSQFCLGASAPEDIRVQWDTARNLWLYAWHVWRFYPVAERQAFSTLEFALRLKLGRDGESHPPGLRKLMDEAISQGLLRDEFIEHHQRIKEFREERYQEHKEAAHQLGWSEPEAPTPTGPQDYCVSLAEYFPKLRNHYAHGCSSLNPSIAFTFSVCRDLIEQLYPDPK
jgi:hypothetical protein